MKRILICTIALLPLLADGREKDEDGVTLVSVENTPEVVVSNTPDVNIANTPNVNVANIPDVSISNTPDVNVANIPSVMISNEVMTDPLEETLPILEMASMVRAGSQGVQCIDFSDTPPCELARYKTLGPRFLTSLYLQVGELTATGTSHCHLAVIIDDPARSIYRSVGSLQNQAGTMEQVYLTFDPALDLGESDDATYEISFQRGLYGGDGRCAYRVSLKGYDEPLD